MLSTSEPQDMMVKYTQPLAVVVFFGVSILKFLLFSVLLTLAFLMWLWTISFQTGRLFAEWTQTKDSNDNKPNVWQVAYKLGEIAIFPLLLLNKWVQKKVEELLKIKFTLLSETTPPPKKCSELPIFQKMIENKE